MNQSAFFFFLKKFTSAIKHMKGTSNLGYIALIICFYLACHQLYNDIDNTLLNNNL